MKIYAGLKLHPRGFLGLPTEVRTPHVSREIKVDFVGAVSRNITIESEDNVLKPNTLIEQLYDIATSKEDELRLNSAFKERLLIAALSAFGTVLLVDWLEKQKQNPYFDTMQNRFVEETVCFVYTGFRKYHPQVYLDTLTIGKVNSYSAGPSTQQFILSKVRTNDSVTVRDFILKWLSHPNGLSDLLISLRVMFGS